MRQKRSKTYKKQMLVYKNTFKFRLPYQIVCDEHIIEETYTKRYNLLNNLNKILQPNIMHASNGSKQETDEASLNPKKTLKLFVTQCSMQHIYETKNEDLIEFVKYNFERRRCNHDYKDPKTSEDCIFSITNVTGKKDENEVIKNINNMVIGSNKHKYIVCTQDINLRRKLRRVPGVPIVHFMNSNVLLLEPTSDTTKQYSENFEAQKLTHGLNDSKNAGFKRSVDQVSISNAPTDTPAAIIKKKVTHNPNPLSVKKKAAKVPVHETKEEPQEETTEPAKKKRKRVRSKKTSDVSVEDKNDDVKEADTSA